MIFKGEALWIEPSSQLTKNRLHFKHINA